jgi:lipopolysaccharide export system permease protein
MDPNNAIPTQFKRFQMETLPCEETPLLMDQIAKPIKMLGMHDLKVILDFFPNDATQVIQHRIEYASIVSSPLICLIIMLIAIPFSLSGVRVNPMVGVSKAIGLLFVYYITCGIGRVLGTQQTLSPTMAAWFPNGVMLVVAFGLYRVCAPK